MRLVRRLLVMVTVAVAVVFATPTHGDAVPVPIPGIPVTVPVGGGGDCKTAPTPQMPATGLSGWIDSGSTNPDPTATDPYSTIEYPPAFHTYDVSTSFKNVTVSCGDPQDSMNTTLANWIKGLATSIVAACNALHRLVSPPKFLSVFDPLLIQGTAAVQKSTYAEYLGLAILIVGVGLIWVARKRKFADAISTVTWMLLIMGVATFLFSYPVKAGHAADDVVTSVSGNIDASIGGSPGVDPASASAIVLTNNVLFRPWLMGELGSADSTVAKLYGVRLLDDQTYTYAEARQINADPTAAAAITKAKQSDFKKVAAAIKKEDPGAYEHLQGGQDRIGAAVISLISAVATAPFMIMADFLRVVALMIWRLGIIFAPAVAVVAIVPKFRKVGMIALSAVSAALVNAIVFALGSSINFLAVRVLLDPNVQLPEWARILLCLAVSIILWKAFKPARKLTTMVSASSISKGALSGLGLGKAARKLGGFAATAAATTGGVLAADEVERKLHPVSERTESFTRPAGEYRWAADTSAPAAHPALESMPVAPDYGPTTVTQPAPVPRTAIGPAEPEIYKRDEPRVEPGRPLVELRGDPVIVDGVQTYRVWSSESQTYEDVEAK